jgi:lysophospholipase L1-like esterase
MRFGGKILFCVTVAAAASLAGCAGVTLNLNPRYLALGDFLTNGTTLSDPVEQAYPTLVSRMENAPVTNLANSGDQACDVAARQIFPNGVSPTLASHPTFSVLIGVNDVDNQGEGVYEQVFEECHQAAIAWLALPAEDKVLSGSAGFEARGPGQIDTSGGWNAWTTQGQGSSVSFTIDTAQAGPIYAWPLVDDNSAATYSYSLDGAVSGTAAVETNPHIATQNGTTRSLGFLRWPYIPAGHHTVTFTQTSAGASGVSVVGIGAPTAGQSGQLPVVLVGNVPYQMHTGANVGCQNSDAPCLAYNTDIQLDVEMMTGDGLNVRLFDTRQYLQSTSAEMKDAVHPNARGQQKLSQAVQAAWPREK